MPPLYDIWSAWQQYWINPWGWALVLIGTYFAFHGIKWRVKFIPWAIAYILFTSVGFSYQHSNFGLAPSTFTSLLALMSFLAFCALPEPKRLPYSRMLLFAGLICAILAELAFFVTERPDSKYIMPVLWNRSMGGSFIVLALAQTPMIWVGLLAAILLSRSTPIAVFIVYWIAEKSSVLRAIVCTFCVSIALYLRGIPTGTGRLDIWRVYWHYWIGLPASTKLFGTHFGTTAALLPIQQSNYAMDQFYIWLHNDFFQALTEFGIVGFSLCAISAIEIFRLCSRKEKAYGLALCTAMATNFPLHWMPEAFVFWYWVRKNGVIPHHQRQDHCPVLPKSPCLNKDCLVSP